MSPDSPETGWNVRTLRPLLPWSNAPIKPADVNDGLVAAMLARENILEDVNYRKIVPNQYIVEVNADNYARNYQRIEGRVIQQWSEKLLEGLLTANRRQGRKEYNLAGRLKIEIVPATDLEPNQARIRCRIEAGEEAPSGSRPSTLPMPPQSGAGGVSTPCLELVPGGQRWYLQPGITSLGRKAINDIHLDSPEIQEKRLISGQHAHIRSEEGQNILFDGSPDGKASVNGTYVNGRPVPSVGHPLKDGDLVILAALDAAHPRTDTPGVAVFRYRQGC